MWPGLTIWEEERLAKVKAEAYEREWGLIAHLRLEFVRWLYAHGRISEYPLPAALLSPD